ncbi:MAG: GDSL-type esterase/lipase family protein [Alphaproteobacteria bacterium]
MARSFRIFFCLLTVAAIVGASPLCAKTIKIVAFGTSNTFGKGVQRSKAYPAKLQQALRAQGFDARVRNSGVNGDTTARMLARLNSAVPSGTHIVIVEPGYNDALRGVSKARVRANLNRILKRLKDRKLKVLLFGVPRNNVSGIARANGALYTPSIRSGFNASFGKTLPKYAAPDGSHLNAKAYAVVVARILPKIKILIKRVK